MNQMCGQLGGEHKQMKELADNVGHVARWISNLSLLAVIFACLVLWGSIALLFTPPLHASDSTVHWEVQYTENAQAQHFPADWSLFWLPIGLGIIICCAGLATLVWTARKRE
jgi:H+/Cl- antiporter ClcA